MQANANKHDDEAIHLSNKKFIKSRDESRMLQWLFFLSLLSVRHFPLNAEKKIFSNRHFIEVERKERVLEETARRWMGVTIEEV